MSLNKKIIVSLLILISPISLVMSEELINCKIKLINASKSAVEKIPESLKYLSPKLLATGMNNFTLVEEKNIKIKKKEPIDVNFKSNDQLKFNIIYKKTEKIGMWLEWFSDSKLLLHSKFHFNCNQDLIAGAESGKDTAKIIAFKFSE